MASSRSHGSELDVVVVGAGLAGLTAARRLTARGLACVVLEARDRVGGRTCSYTLPGGDTVDLGAQWIGPTQNRVAALAREFGLTTFKQYTTGAKVLSLADKIVTYQGPIPRVPLLSLLFVWRMIRQLDRMAAEVPLDAPFSGARARDWDAMTVEGWKRRTTLTSPARALLDVAVRAIFAAEPAELSFLFFLFYLHSGGGLLNLSQADGGAQQTRFIQGAQALSLRLAALLGDRVICRAPVRAIAHDRDGVVVRCDAGEYRARHAIVAVPPTLASRIVYAPPLPAARDQLTQRVTMGAVLKCVAFYERPFWRADGLSGEAISSTGPLTLVYDDSPEHGRHGALLAFVLGDQARRLSTRPPQDRQQLVVGALTRLFGPRAAEITGYVDMDWTSEEWTRGCYVGLMPPGTLTACGAGLRAPVGRIHWAGTETATVWYGYMDGAIESGERASDEILSE